MLLTDNEREILRSIINSEFQDGYTKELIVNNPVWTNCVSTDIIKGKQFSGVIASLSKKSLIFIIDDMCCITEYGWNIFHGVDE